MNNMNQQQMDPRRIMMEQVRTQFRTSGILKFCIMTILGLLPMIIMWSGFRSSSNDTLMNSKPLWGFVSYGVTWAIGLGVWFTSMGLGWLLVKYTSDFKIDIVGSIGSASFLIFILYISPALPVWARFLIAIPLTLIMMVIINIFSYLMYFASQTKGLRAGAADFKKMFQTPKGDDLQRAMSQLDEQLKSQGFDVHAFDELHKDKKVKKNKNEVNTEVKIKDKTEKIDNNKTKKKDEK